MAGIWLPVCGATLLKGIGRAALKLALRQPELKLVAVNESGQERFEKRPATATRAGPCLIGPKACCCHPDTTFGWRPVAPVPQDSTPDGTCG